MRRSCQSRDTQAKEERNRHFTHFVVTPDCYVFGYFKRRFASDPIAGSLQPEQELHVRFQVTEGEILSGPIEFSVDGRTFLDMVNHYQTPRETLSDRAFDWFDSKIIASAIKRRALAASRMEDIPKPSGPPRFGEYLLYLFMAKVPRLNLLGDLEEEYAEVLEKFGKRKADFWFYKQVGSSLWPLIRRIIIKGSLFFWAAKKVFHQVFF